MGISIIEHEIFNTNGLPVEGCFDKRVFIMLPERVKVSFKIDFEKNCLRKSATVVGGRDRASTFLKVDGQDIGKICYG